MYNCITLSNHQVSLPIICKLNELLASLQPSLLKIAAAAILILIPLLSEEIKWVIRIRILNLDKHFDFRFDATLFTTLSNTHTPISSRFSRCLFVLSTILILSLILRQYHHWHHLFQCTWLTLLFLFFVENACCSSILILFFTRLFMSFLLLGILV